MVRGGGIVVSIVVFEPRSPGFNPCSFQTFSRELAVSKCVLSQEYSVKECRIKNSISYALCCLNWLNKHGHRVKNLASVTTYETSGNPHVTFPQMFLEWKGIAGTKI